MKLDVTQVLYRLDDPEKPLYTKPKLNEKGEENTDRKELTLRFVLVESLLASYKGEENLEQSKKLARWHLAKRIQKDDAPDLKLQDVALCQKLVVKAYPLLISGPAGDLLEAAAGEKLSKDDHGD